MRTFSPRDVFPDPALPLRVITTQTARGRYPMHGHAFTELEVIVSGAATEIVNGVLCSISAGDVFVLHPGEVHNVRTANNLHTYLIQFLPEQLVPHLDVLRRLPGYCILFDPLPAGATPRGFSARLRLNDQQLLQAQQLLTTMNREMIAKLPGYQHNVLGCLLQLLTFLSRGCDPQTQQAALSLDLLAPAMNYIEQHAHEPIALTKLADICGMSNSTLIRQFRKITGHAPIEYVIRRRVVKSIDLLCGEKTSITDVAFASGFDDSNYYARQFKRVMGVTPRAYRKAYKPRRA